MTCDVRCMKFGLITSYLRIHTTVSIDEHKSAGEHLYRLACSYIQNTSPADMEGLIVPRLRNSTKTSRKRIARGM